MEVTNLVSQLQTRLSSLWREPALLQEPFLADVTSLVAMPGWMPAVGAVGSTSGHTLFFRACDLLPEAAIIMLHAGYDATRSHANDHASENRSECLYAAFGACKRDEKAGRCAAAHVLLRELLEFGLDPNEPRFNAPLVYGAYAAPKAGLLLVNAGADPFAKTAVGETAYSAARLREYAVPPHMKEDFTRLVARMREIGLQRPPPKGGSVRLRKPGLAPSRDRGAASFRKRIGWPGADNDFVVVAAEVDTQRLADALASATNARRIEAGIASRRVPDPTEGYAVMAMVGNPWALSLLHSGSPVRGTGQLERVIRSLTLALHTRVVEVWQDRVIVHSASGGSVEQAVLAVDEESLDAGPLDSRLADLGILVPPMGRSGDGLWFELTIEGLRKSDLLQVDLVVVRE